MHTAPSSTELETGSLPDFKHPCSMTSLLSEKNFCITKAISRISQPQDVKLFLCQAVLRGLDAFSNVFFC